MKRVLAAVAAGIVLLVLGIAIGEALHDNPKPDFMVTRTKTFTP